MFSARTLVLACVTAFLFTDSSAVAKFHSYQPQRSDTTVRNTGQPRFPGVATLREEMAIGRNDGSDEYLIVGSQGMALGPDGSVYLADRGVARGGMLTEAASIRRFDSTGRFVRKIGRAGQGPGEYAAFSGMHVLRDGRLLQYDASGAKVSIFSANGDFVSSFKTVPGTAGSNGFFVDPASNIYVRAPFGSSITDGPSPSIFIRYDLTGTVLDTVFPPPVPELPLLQLTVTSGTRRRNINVPFGPTFLTWFSPLGYWVSARTDRYAIDLNLPTRQGQTISQWKPGSPVTSIRRNETQVPLSADERSAFRSQVEQQLRGMQPGWTWNGPDIPRNKPYFLVLITDRDGRIWARVFDPAEKLDPAMDMDDGSENLWDVFEPAGVYVGRIRTGVGVLPQNASGNRLWTVQRDADGVQRIARMQIVGWGAR